MASAKVAALLALSLLGDSLLYVVLPLYPAEFGITFAWVGILLSVNRFVRIFAYGAIADVGRHIGARSLSIAATIGATLSTALYGLAQGEPLMLAARVLWGLAFGALNLTMLVYAVQETRRAGRTVGLSRAISGLGPVASLTVGAWLVGHTGPNGVFLVLAGVTAISVPLAFAVPPAADSPSKRRTPALPWPSRIDIWAFALGFAVDGIFVMTISVLLNGVVSLQSAVVSAGLLLALRRLVEVILAPLGGAIGDRCGTGRMILLCGTLLAAGLLVIAADHVYAGAIMVVLMHGMLTTLGPVHAAERASRDHLTALAGFVTWRDVGAALGPLVAGSAVGLVGWSSLYGALAALILLVLLADRKALTRRML
jgi:MFS transporter, DHA1 family, inner membrane transport protein